MKNIFKKMLKRLDTVFWVKKCLDQDSSKKWRIVTIAFKERLLIRKDDFYVERRRVRAMARTSEGLKNPCYNACHE